MDSSVSSGFTNFAICGSDAMYNTLYNFCRTPSDIHIHLKINGCVFNGCGVLQMASYRK